MAVASVRPCCPCLRGSPVSTRSAASRGTTWAESGPRWFGVKVWKTWLVAGTDAYVEESIYVVRAPDSASAQHQAGQAARRDAIGYLNEEGEAVDIHVSRISTAYDMKTTRLTSGLEVFSQLFEVSDDGVIDWDWPGSGSSNREREES